MFLTSTGWREQHVANVMTLHHAEINLRFGAQFPNLIGTAEIKHMAFQNAKTIAT
jgi:hypothetical protein